MPKYTQANRPMAVTTPLGDDVLLLVGFGGSEAVSRPFEFRLDLLAETDADIAFDRLLGQAVTVRLTLPNRGQRYFSGIVRRFGQGGPVTAADGKTVFYRYRAEVVPQLWLLTRKVQSRIFQQISVPDILKQVLQQEWKLNVSSEIQGNFAPRDYVVQYRESDFAFVSRLMEEEGIFYFFTHTENGHQLILANTPQSHPEVPGSSTLTYEAAAGGHRDEDRVQSWEKNQEVRSGKYTVWDYSFELPDKNLAADRTIAESVAAGRVTHKLRVAGNEQFEIYQYPGGYAQRFDGIAPSGQDRAGDLQKIFDDNGRTAGIRIQEEAAAGLVATGESNCRNFVTGHRFALKRHFNADGEYVLTRVEHAATQESGYLVGADQPFEYRNRFECLPLALPFRPPRLTPKPVIAGTQTAVVVGPSGEDIFLDKYGRVKVQFHWDRQGKKDANSSCWVRVGQVWAGPRWGAFFWPRVGHEVIVAFEEGDPDQPIVVGNVYNAANMPPFELPGESAVGGIKSCSFGPDASAGENFNGVVFYDQTGDEHLQLHSERHDISNSETSRHVHVGQTHTTLVGGFGAGSGSGGGPAAVVVGGSGAGGGAGWSWASTTPTGTFASDTNVTIGFALSVTTPLETDVIVGSYFDIIVNPLGWIGGAGPAFGEELSGPMAGLMGTSAMMGALTFVLGAVPTLTYGPSYAITRGNEVSYSGALDAPQTALAMVTAALYIAAPVIAGLYPNDLAAVLGTGFGITGAAGIALALLISVETKTAYAENIKSKAEEADKLAATITKVATPIADGLALAAQDRALESAKLIGNALTQAEQNLAAVQQTANQAVDHTRTFRSNYTVNAYNISLNSAWDPDPLQPGVPPATTSINIAARGVGPVYQTGILTLSGTQQASLSSGLGTVAVYSEMVLGNIVANCGPDGSITLQRGSLVPSPSQTLQLLPGAIFLDQISPGDIVIRTLDAGQVQIQAGEALIMINSTGLINIMGGTVKVTALEAISLTVEENSITVDPAGVEISGLTNQIQSEVAHQVETLTAQMQADAEMLQDIVMNMLEG